MHAGFNEVDKAHKENIKMIFHQNFSTSYFQILEFLVESVCSAYNALTFSMLEFVEV